MIDVASASRYIAVAAPSGITDEELRNKHPSRSLLTPVYNDYALMKVLYNLRRRSSDEQRVHVHSFQHTDPVTPLNFSGLRDTAVIFIVGHGSDQGLHELGPDAEEGMRRLVNILTGDGNLKRRRDGKKIIILLLSCRAGLGFHKALARRLSQRLSIDVTVGGAVGFTFGSGLTGITAHNEVLIRGIPWDMEYPDTITRQEAEEATSAREGKTITVAAKQTEINKFVVDKRALEKEMDAIVRGLRSTEVNLALNELDDRFRSRWEALTWKQFELYAHAKKRSNLEFDMWFERVHDGYVWTDGRKVTDAEANAILTGDLVPVGTGFTSTR